MQLHLLYYFRSVAKSGSLTKSAKELHIAQPALSKQMAKLERLVGAELFKRTGRGIKLTEAGSKLLFHAERILADWDSAVHSIKELGLSGRGYLRIAVYPTFMWYILPNFLPDFIRNNPDTDLEIELGLTDAVTGWVIGHHMEAGIVIGPAHHPQLKEYPLQNERFGLLLPAGHPWARRKCVPFKDLHGQPLIISTLSRWYENFILPKFKKMDVQPEIRYVVHQYDVIKELVRVNLGFSLVPTTAFELWKKKEKGVSRELALVPTDPVLERQYIWIERQDRKRSATAQKFYEELCQYLRTP